MSTSHLSDCSCFSVGFSNDFSDGKNLPTTSIPIESLFDGYLKGYFLLTSCLDKFLARRPNPNPSSCINAVIVFNSFGSQFFSIWQRGNKIPTCQHTLDML